MADGLTHLDEHGHARMVDVGDKPISHRVCIARGEVRMAPETLKRIVEGRVAKGDVLATARIADPACPSDAYRHGRGRAGTLA